MSLDQQPRTHLAFLPTPIQELSKLRTALKRPRILIKRDDQTGLALGGNKTRKLEYLFGDALQYDIDTILTAGAAQSNHCRQTAAAAARMGLRCELLLNGNTPHLFEGNVLLDKLLGAHLHWKDEEGTAASLDELAERARAAWRKPYVIPYGGSNVFGAMGYVNAMIELAEQQKLLTQPITHIVFASCSGATHVGMVVGAALTHFSGTILGISVDYDASQQANFEQGLVDLANATALKIGIAKRFIAEEFTVSYEYAKGYGVLGELEHDAVHRLAAQEGILLDPVYSGRAFGALLDMIAKGYFSEDDTVLFWHTGGTPALFSYAEKLAE